MSDFMDYIIHSYLFGFVILCIGTYSLWYTIKNPLPKNETRPMEENYRGIIFGIGFMLIGGFIVIAKLFFNW